MLEQLNTYDWREAFKCAGPDIEDVEEVIAEYEGANDEGAWLSFGRLKNGNFYFMRAWCDYTGWDCRAGGDSYENESRENVERFGMGDGERQLLNIVLPEIDGVKPIEDMDDNFSLGS